MSIVYDIESGQSIESLMDQFESFHDWVLECIRVFPSEDDMMNESETQIQYNAEVTIRDPYKRFVKNKVILEFVDIDCMSIKGLTEISSELQGMSVVRSLVGVKISTEDHEYFSIEARTVTCRVL